MRFDLEGTVVNVGAPDPSFVRCVIIYQHCLVALGFSFRSAQEDCLVGFVDGWSNRYKLKGSPSLGRICICVAWRRGPAWSVVLAVGVSE